MIEQWAAALEATPLAAGLRESVWSYPLVNAAHILGIALLVGSIVPFDLRLLGLWRSIPLGSLRPILTRTAAAGFALAIVFGALLFIARAAEYVASGLFTAKMAFIAVGAFNALALSLSDAAPEAQRPPAPLRLSAALSLFAWLGALVLGRLVGYF